MALAQLGELELARSYYDQLAAELPEKPSVLQKELHADAAQLLSIELPPNQPQSSDESTSSKQPSTATE